jgi:hypothetical protein
VTARPHRMPACAAHTRRLRAVAAPHTPGSPRGTPRDPPLSPHHTTRKGAAPVTVVPFFPPFFLSTLAVSAPPSPPPSYPPWPPESHRHRQNQNNRCRLSPLSVNPWSPSSPIGPRLNLAAPFPCCRSTWRPPPSTRVAYYRPPPLPINAFASSC